jgi:glycosyltransferase involved in cell wall biosynthesis
MENFQLKDSVFGKQLPRISPEAQVIFVADMFAEDYGGGAELTTEALITSSPLNVVKIRSKEVTMELLKEGIEKYWIFGNFAGLNPQLIPSIVGNLHYSILEYDYKYCKYRSPEKHQTATQLPCDCHNQMNGKLISAFFYGAENLWWMSEGQKEKYATMFPFLLEKSNIVLSSVFDKKTLGTIKLLREKTSSENLPRKGWIVLGSDSWVKGADAAKQWCEKNQKDYEVVWNLSYNELLAKLSVAEGFVYLPAGKDTCPRMVIEAKLLGCKLQLNDNVQHKDEEWFNVDDIQSIEDYLYAATGLFWNGTIATMNHNPKISGYVTVKDAEKQKYPWRQSIKSLLGFCDEVCVVDGGSTDGTWEELTSWAEKEDKLVLRQVKRNWDHPRFAVFDGEQKAEARGMCTGEFCWQMDVDEVVHEDDYKKILAIVKKFPKGVDLLALPVVEYWGSAEKVRVDVNPWKWRLSKNNPTITHGIPATHRRLDESGNLYSTGSDGCDYVYKDNFEPVPFVNFYTQEADNARKNSLEGDRPALLAYQEWMNNVVENLPGVYHYSWFDIERKIHTYKSYWSRHWTSLFNQIQEDIPKNNKFFGKKWSEVTDKEISNLALRLKEEMGGWVFHALVDFSQPTPWLYINKHQPRLMEEWIDSKK